MVLVLSGLSGMDMDGSGSTIFSIGRGSVGQRDDTHDRLPAGKKREHRPDKRRPASTTAAASASPGRHQALAAGWPSHFTGASACAGASVLEVRSLPVRGHALQRGLAFSGSEAGSHRLHSPQLATPSGRTTRRPPQAPVRGPSCRGVRPPAD